MFDASNSFSKMMHIYSNIDSSVFWVELQLRHFPERDEAYRMSCKRVCKSPETKVHTSLAFHLLNRQHTLLKNKTVSLELHKNKQVGKARKNENPLIFR
jgi:hypothetical protein